MVVVKRDCRNDVEDRTKKVANPEGLLDFVRLRVNEMRRLCFGKRCGGSA